MEVLHQIRLTGSTLYLKSWLPNPAGRNPGTRWPGRQGGIPVGQMPEVSPVFFDPKVSSLKK